MVKIEEEELRRSEKRERSWEREKKETVGLLFQCEFYPLHLGTLKYRFLHTSPYIYIFVSKNTPYIVKEIKIKERLPPFSCSFAPDKKYDKNIIKNYIEILK